MIAVIFCQQFCSSPLLFVCTFTQCFFSLEILLDSNFCSYPKVLNRDTILNESVDYG